MGTAQSAALYLGVLREEQGDAKGAPMPATIVPSVSSLSVGARSRGGRRRREVPLRIHPMKYAALCWWSRIFPRCVFGGACRQTSPRVAARDRARRMGGRSVRAVRSDARAPTRHLSRFVQAEIAQRRADGAALSRLLKSDMRTRSGHSSLRQPACRVWGTWLTLGQRSWLNAHVVGSRRTLCDRSSC